MYSVLILRHAWPTIILQSVFLPLTKQHTLAEQNMFWFFMCQQRLMRIINYETLNCVSIDFAEKQTWANKIFFRTEIKVLVTSIKNFSDFICHYINFQTIIVKKCHLQILLSNLSLICEKNMNEQTYTDKKPEKSAWKAWCSLQSEQEPTQSHKSFACAREEKHTCRDSMKNQCWLERIKNVWLRSFF